MCTFYLDNEWLFDDKFNFEIVENYKCPTCCLDDKSKIMVCLKIANDLWRWRWLPCQMSHNHFPSSMNLLATNKVLNIPKRH